MKRIYEQVKVFYKQAYSLKEVISNGPSNLKQGTKAFEIEMLVALLLITSFLRSIELSCWGSSHIMRVFLFLVDAQLRFV